MHPLFLEELSGKSLHWQTIAIVTAAVKSSGGLVGSYLVKGEEVLKTVKISKFILLAFDAIVQNC